MKEDLLTHIVAFDLSKIHPGDALQFIGGQGRYRKKINCLVKSITHSTIVLIMAKEITNDNTFVEKEFSIHEFKGEGRYELQTLFTKVDWLSHDNLKNDKEI